MEVFLVVGFYVGDNGGSTIQRVFATEADAAFYAEHAKDRQWNHAGWGATFDVERYEVVASLDAVRDELAPPPATA